MLEFGASEGRLRPISLSRLTVAEAELLNVRGYDVVVNEGTYLSLIDSETEEVKMETCLFDAGDIFYGAFGTGLKKFTGGKIGIIDSGKSGFGLVNLVNELRDNPKLPDVVIIDTEAELKSFEIQSKLYNDELEYPSREFKRHKKENQKQSWKKDYHDVRRK